MGTLRYLLLRLLGDDQAVKPVNVDDTDCSAAPRLQHPERYDNIDLAGVANGFPAELGGSWSTGDAPLPAYPHMSRRQARQWARLRARDAADGRGQDAEEARGQESR